MKRLHLLNLARSVPAYQRVMDLELAVSMAVDDATMDGWYVRTLADWSIRTAREIRDVVSSRVRFVRDKYLVGPGKERVHHPEWTVRNGGDCEDMNLVIAGGLLRALGVEAVYSVYSPNIKDARHVWVGWRDGNGVGYSFDAVPGGHHVKAGWSGPGDLYGELVEW